MILDAQSSGHCATTVRPTAPIARRVTACVEMVRLAHVGSCRLAGGDIDPRVMEDPTVCQNAMARSCLSVKFSSSISPSSSFVPSWREPSVIKAGDRFDSEACSLSTRPLKTSTAFVSVIVMLDSASRWS